MASNSSTPAPTLRLSPDIPRHAVQGAVDEAGLRPLEEGLGDLDIFVDRRPRPARRAGGSARRRRRAGWRAAVASMPLQPPARSPGAWRWRGRSPSGPRPRRARSRRRRPRRPRPARSPSMSASKRWSVNSRITASTPAPDDLHLVERLHGRQPRHGERSLPKAWPARPLSCSLSVRGRHRLSSSALQAIMSRQARAAPPPLSPSLTRARAQAWSSSSTVRMPLPMHEPLADRQVHQAPRATSSADDSRSGWSRRGSRSPARHSRRRRTPVGAVAGLLG